MTSKIKEINVIQKPKSSIQWRIGLVYPNSYQVGMSGLTIKLLYSLLNQHPNISTERIFYSAKDPRLPTSLETKKNLHQFDILAFTFQFELDYINAIRMLQQSKIPILLHDRSSSYPILIAGGPTVTINPGPLLKIFDLFFIGEIESVVLEFLQTIVNSKFKSLKDSISSISGFYYPDIKFEKWFPVITPDLDKVPFPTAQVRPLVKEKKKGSLNGFFLQITRGCPHGCHFCLIGKAFRPMRERSLANLELIIKKGSIETQTNFFSLIGSSTAEYSKIDQLIDFFSSKKLKFTLPSIRMDSGIKFLEKLNYSGQKNLSVAPETGSEILRKKIGKNLSNQQIKDFITNAERNGIRELKFYYIIGLSEDPVIEGQQIADFTQELVDLFPSIRFKLSVNPLIPKLGTKLSSHPINYSSIQEGLEYLKLKLKSKHQFKTFPIEWATIQAILSLGGPELTPILSSVANNGGTLQSWKKILKGNPIEFFKSNYQK
ncbi:B12-binding domain-containing radical SAM protein [Candidatus Hodarchaeum mangrovi]